MIDYLDKEFELVLEKIKSDNNTNLSSIFFYSTRDSVSQDIIWQHMSYLTDNIVYYIIAQYNPKLFLNNKSLLSHSEVYTLSINVDR